MYFEYGEKELIYLKQKDKRLAEVIDQVGMIERTVDDDLFSSVVHHIVGQQISTKAQATIWQRMKDYLGTVDADTILNAGVEHLQPLGISFRKAEYITDFAEKVKDGSFDIEGIWKKSDEEAIEELSSLKGIAISALSCCISRPVKCPAFVFAAIRIGITPVPVPISRTLSPGFAFANPESKTASIPKQNFFGFWMIWYPLLCRSSSLSSGYSLIVI